MDLYRFLRCSAFYSPLKDTWNIFFEIKRFILLPVKAIVRRLPIRAIRKLQQFLFNKSPVDDSSQVSLESFDFRVAELIEIFSNAFPTRNDKLSKSDLEAYRGIIREWQALFDCYDLIQAYSTDPILPMLVGRQNYVAYEHGTIRDIPFQSNSVGRLTALSYKLSAHSFITNPDCIHAVSRLGLEAYSFVPHVIDSKYYTKEEKRAYKNRYIFCPSRHDWEVKGTDITIRGFDSFRKEHEFSDYHLLMTSWGKDIEKSKMLVQELGISEFVYFIPPLSISKLIKFARDADTLIDQFKGYFGGIAPTALAVGTPLIMHLDFSKYEWCFTSVPPYFDANSSEELAEALRMSVSIDRYSYASKSLDWLQKNYWYKTVVEEHLHVYSQFIE